MVQVLLESPQALNRPLRDLVLALGKQHVQFDQGFGVVAQAFGIDLIEGFGRKWPDHFVLARSPDDIRADVRRVKALLGPSLIVSPSHEALLPNVPPENVLAMLRAVLGEEDYHQAWERAALGPRPGSI